MLGDGSLESSGFNGSRLQIKQANRKREYVQWIYSKFSKIVRTPPKERMDTNQWYFGTRYDETLDLWRREFYHDRTKVVPINICDLIKEPIALAVWYMDDGSLDYREKSHYSFTLSTDSFTLIEVGRLKQVLYENFGVESNIQLLLSRGKRYPKLYIGRKGRDQFHTTILPYVLDCFRYKMPPRSMTPQRLNPSQFIG